MKKDGKVIQFKSVKNPLEGQIVLQSVSLTHIYFDFNPDDEGDWSEESPEFEIGMAIIGQTEDSELITSWDLGFRHRSLIMLDANYEALVAISGVGEIVEDELVKQTAFPILAEFSLLFATLSKEATGLPYVIDPVELFDLAWGLEDLEEYF